MMTAHSSPSPATQGRPIRSCVVGIIRPVKREYSYVANRSCLLSYWSPPVWIGSWGRRSSSGQGGTSPGRPAFDHHSAPDRSSNMFDVHHTDPHTYIHTVRSELGIRDRKHVYPTPVPTRLPTMPVILTRKRKRKLDSFEDIDVAVRQMGLTFGEIDERFHRLSPMTDRHVTKPSIGRDPMMLVRDRETKDGCSMMLYL